MVHRTLSATCVHACILYILTLLKFVVRVCYSLSGVGRYRNESYGEFLRALNSAKRLNTRIGPREVYIYMHVHYSCNVHCMCTSGISCSDDIVHYIGEANWNQWLWLQYLCTTCDVSFRSVVDQVSIWSCSVRHYMQHTSKSLSPYSLDLVASWVPEGRHSGRE